MSKTAGYTLVEVVISIMLTAVMVSAVLGVALSTKSSGGKADRKVLGSQAVSALSEALKGYVTGDTTATTINGPNFHARGNHNVNSWNIFTPGIQEDWSCSSPCTFGQCAPTLTAQQDVYALQSGMHCLKCVAATTAGADASCFMPKLLRDPPYNGSVFYNVSYAATGAPPQVQVAVWWNEQ